jgi:Flp pilus assembly pilin Flp
MSDLTTLLSRLHHDERGQGMTEYVIILVAIAVVCIAIAVQFGGKIKALFEQADVQIDLVEP